MHSGIYELQYRADEQARGRVDNRAIARRSHQVAQESGRDKTSRARRPAVHIGKFASDIAFDIAAVFVILAVISVGTFVMGGVMSASASVGDPVEIFQQPDDPRSEAPRASIPEIDNGDDSDDPVEDGKNPSRGPGQAAPVPSVSRSDLGLPLNGAAPGRWYLFAGHGDDNDAPASRASVPDIAQGDPGDDPQVEAGNGTRSPGQAAPVPSVSRSDLGLPLNGAAPGRWYLFAGHGDDNDAPDVE